MPTLKLDLLVIPTYNTQTLGVADASVYPTDPPLVVSPTIYITPPGFPEVMLDFVPNSVSVYTTETLNITASGDATLPLPDGVYYIKYTVNPAYENYVEKSIIRIDQLQEKFDGAFMKLDMMECDGKIKMQSKVNLSTIYFFIQGALAAANNCAIDESAKLYNQADKMLTNFLNNGCGCSSNNYL